MEPGEAALVRFELRRDRHRADSLIHLEPVLFLIDFCLQTRDMTLDLFCLLWVHPEDNLEDKAVLRGHLRRVLSEVVQLIHRVVISGYFAKVALQLVNVGVSVILPAPMLHFTECIACNDHCRLLRLLRLLLRGVVLLQGLLGWLLLRFYHSFFILFSYIVGGADGQFKYES